MRTYPTRRRVLPSTRNRFIGPGSPETVAEAWYALAGRIGAAWPSANKPVAIPFRLSQGCTVVQLGWVNGGGTMTDSVDIGIYDTGWNRLVSGGGAARSGASAWQWADVADTELSPGKYYLAMSNNGTTANNVQFFGTGSNWGQTITLAWLGCYDSATDAYPLPNPLTNMVAVATFPRMPVWGIQTRVPF